MQLGAIQELHNVFFWIFASNLSVRPDFRNVVSPGNWTPQPTLHYVTLQLVLICKIYVSQVHARKYFY